jgi:hypothetical protein
MVGLIRQILQQEHEASISPINEYMRHTLKAFAYYIQQAINTSIGKNRVGVDLGEVKQKKKIGIDDENYTIVLRDSGQIQLFDSSGDKVVARPRLIEFLKEKNISVDEAKENTRTLGKKVFDYLAKEKNEQV